MVKRASEQEEGSAQRGTDQTTTGCGDDGGGGGDDDDGDDEETDEEATRQCRWTQDELQKKRHAICHRGTRERSWADWREIGLGCLRNNERVAEESLIFAVRVDGPCSSCSGDGGPGDRTGSAKYYVRPHMFFCDAGSQGQVRRVRARRCCLGERSAAVAAMGTASMQSWTCSRKTREAGAAIDFGCGAQQCRPSVADSRPRPRPRPRSSSVSATASVKCICIALSLGLEKK
ncbi:hypothetical protein COCSADRAFT_194305 [Bipolaris sorokiniana ND90Pr]|uniref:Uncharacterized protein n=1 Tax=Cochliobolus sativus (strain ND90Pr / ATCC 201652) TaxID=665912 RepID=M2S8F5_COCSN|nr:uncharacterized protein COCSADRAFT_194305 [Bipolaris sorokiniana ND90Pr]EMD58875.1 hypothetical protein COCSADRAFT_194305 [Bipolaris sorokiniana ND90Pr]